MNLLIKNIVCLIIIVLSVTPCIIAQTPNTCSQGDAQLFVYSRDIDTRTSYTYFTMGTGPVILIPSLGIGYRSRKSHHGFDTSLNASTIILAHSIQGSLLYHYYPDIKRQDPWYVGAGMTGGCYFENNGGAAMGFGPDFVVGKELYSHRNKKHFLEAHIQAPTWFTKSFKRCDRLDFPFVYIKYGLAF